MNFLAHSYLARDQGNGRAGAILADLLKNSEGLPRDVEREMRLHRAVDSFTDAHPAVLESKRLFQPDSRRYAGILLDVYYDHLLVKAWPQYSAQPLGDFIADTHACLLAHEAAYPPRVAHVVRMMVAEQWLQAYASMEGIETTIRRIASRLSRGQARMISGIEDLYRHADAIEAGFTRFLPELIAFSDAQRPLVEARMRLQGDVDG